MFRFLRVVPTRLFTPVAGLRGSGAAVTAAVASLPLPSPGFHPASTAAAAANKRQAKQQPTPNKKNGARVKPAAMWTDAAIGTIAGYDQYGPNAHDAPHIRHTTNAYLAARRAEGKKFAEAQLRYRATPTKRSVERSSSVRSSGGRTEDPYAGELTHYLQDEPETYRTTTSWGTRSVTRDAATPKKKPTTKTAARDSPAILKKKAANKAASTPATTTTAAAAAKDVPEYYRPRLYHAHPYRHRFQSSQALGEDCEASREGQGPDPVPDGKKPRVGEVVMGRRLWQLQPHLKKGSLGSTAGLD